MTRISKQIIKCFERGNKVLIIGNGGSSAEASHLSEELIAYGYPAIALNDPCVLTALSNDFSYEEVFSRYIIAVGAQGDVLITLSTSGKSKNIIRAIKTAKQKSMEVIELPRNKGKTTETIQNHQLELIHKVYKEIVDNS